VGRVPETLRVREHIDLFSSYYEKPMSPAEVLAAVGLEKLRDRKFSELSGGIRFMASRPDERIGKFCWPSPRSAWAWRASGSIVTRKKCTDEVINLQPPPCKEER
jgi:hypothetical protein